MSMLDPDRWRSLSPYLDQALAMPGADRGAWVASLRARDPDLGEQLQILLDEHGALVGERFLECAPAAFGQLAFAGQTVGAYTLRSLIGQGGMGTVWLGERSDGRFERRAAVKFLSIPLGGRGEERFKREGRILASLTHRHIAQLIDAGVSATGQPFLVVEHVDGEPIDRYCDQRTLDVAARVRLFIDVLGAVAHAHSNLIVHRDIKPSNVLVTGDGHAKLLDFGIAKPLEEGELSSAATLLTLEAGAALTPAYAAPEQVTGGPISTATDVYALGVLLYVLLSGRHPSGDTLHSPADLFKAITDAEPPRASDAVTETRAPASPDATASRRASTPDKLRRLLRGDLDTILNKALKKNPRERYASVTAFVDDLRRYLNHQPISARPDTIVYRTAKFVRRNRVAVAAAALTLASLSVGLYAANRERAIAQRRFLQVRQLANKVLALDSEIGGLPGSTKVRHEIVAMSKEYLEALLPDAQADRDLALEIGAAYSKLALVQGVPTTQNLGQYAQAEESLRKADALLQSVLAASPQHRAALLDSAHVATSRMILADSDRRRDDALIQARKAAGLLNAWLGLGKAPDVEAERAMQCFGNIALFHKNAKLFPEAIAYARREIELSKGVPLGQDYAANGWSIVADSMRLSGDLDGALGAIREARISAETAAFRTEHRRRSTLFNVMWREGVILGEEGRISLGRSEEAIGVLQKAFDLIEEWARKDSYDASSRMLFSSAGRELGSLLRKRDPARALAVYDLALRRLGEIKDNRKARRDELVLLAGSSYPLQSLGRSAEARQRLNIAFERLKQLTLYPADQIVLGSEADSVLRALADHEAGIDNLARAIEIYRNLRERVLAAGPNPENSLADAADLSRLYASLAVLERRAGRTGPASELETRQVQLWEHWDRKLPGNPFVARQIAAIPRSVPASRGSGGGDPEQ